jgi:hypothetical protein
MTVASLGPEPLDHAGQQWLKADDAFGPQVEANMMTSWASPRRALRDAR